MVRALRWYEYIWLSVFWWGISSATGVITPILLPFLVALMVPSGEKNTYVAIIRVVSLAVAMAIQPMAGLLSDRNPSRWGRRRPYVAGGTLASLLFLIPIGLSAQFATRGWGLGAERIASAFALLLTGVVLWQAAANVAQGAMQGLIPDLVPEHERGRASGAKAVMELLAIVPVVFVGPLIDGGKLWQTLTLIAAVLVVPLLITLLGVREERLCAVPAGSASRLLARFLLLPLILVAAAAGGGLLVRIAHGWLGKGQISPLAQGVSLSLWVLLCMSLTIVLGVRLGVRIGVGGDAVGRPSFAGWVTNRLLFLTAVGSIQGYVLYYLRDVHQVPNAAAMTSRLAAVLGAGLLLSAAGSGLLADRVGHRRLVAAAGLLAVLGDGLLIGAPNLHWVMAAACVMGVAAGTFMAASWALGTQLAPAEQAGRYLGVSNLAGAGAGIVGAGIGGPLVDALNALGPGWGYLGVFAVYGGLFVLSVAVLLRVREPARQLG